MSRRYLRPGVLVGHLLVLAAVLTCLRLGWWQWDVSREARGTVQNLGYALLWPVFAGSFIYMWLRFLHLESMRDAEQVAGADAGADGDADPGPMSAAGRPGPGAAPVTLEAPPGHRPALGADAADTLARHAADAPGDGGAPGADAADRGAGTGDGATPREPAPREAAPNRDRGRRSRRPPTETYTVAVATVGGDDDDDPELAAYNQALAALAEQDRRRAR